MDTLMCAELVYVYSS